MRTLRAITGLLAIVCGTVSAQIPNAGFESWTGTDPESWATSNGAPTYVNVTKSSAAHSGSTAARGEVILLAPGFALQPILQSGSEGEGFPISYRPYAITGWYQFSPVGGDRFGVNVGLFKGGSQGTAVAVAASADATAYGSYVQFTVPFLYLTADIPDTCIIQHQIIGPTTGMTWHVGSFFLVDDLAFSGTNDVAGETAGPQTFLLHQNFPNPFNPSTVIRYALPTNSHVVLSVYNMLGQLEATLVEGEKSAGYHEVRFDASGLPSGVYLYRLQAGTFIQTRKLALVR